MLLFEIDSPIFYHGSQTLLPKKVRLVANPASAQTFRVNSALTHYMETRKPPDQPSRLKCWFLCDNAQSVKQSSASTNYIYQVTPAAPVFKHYYGWVNFAVAMMKQRGVKSPVALSDDPQFNEYIDNYWSGVELTRQQPGLMDTIIYSGGGGGMWLVEYTTEAIFVLRQNR